MAQTTVAIEMLFNPHIIITGIDTETGQMLAGGEPVTRLVRVAPDLVYAESAAGGVVFRLSDWVASVEEWTVTPVDIT